MKVTLLQKDKYYWFQRIIFLLDKFIYLNIKTAEDLNKLQNPANYDLLKEQDVLPTTCITKLNNMQMNALMSYNMWNGEENSVTASDNTQWSLLNISKYKVISATTNVALKTPDYLVMLTRVKYNSREVYCYTVYDNSVTASELSEPPLAVCTICNDTDIYNLDSINIHNDMYEYHDKTGIVIIISNTTKQVYECFYEQQSTHSSFSNVVQTLQNSSNQLSKAIGSASEEVIKRKDLMSMKLSGSLSSTIISAKQLQWITQTFDIDEAKANEGIQSIVTHLHRTMKGKEINIFGNIFKILDLTVYNKEILMLRTTYFDESSQLIFLLDIGESACIANILILDVFPHEKKSGLNYTIDDIIQTSSDDNISGISKVETNVDADVFTVTENIDLFFRDMTFHIEDTVTLGNTDADVDPNSCDVNNGLNTLEIEKTEFTARGDSLICNTSELQEMELKEEDANNGE